MSSADAGTVPETEANADSAPKVRPRVRTAIAVLVTRFPRVDEAFILREIDQLERHGQPVRVVPLLPGGEQVVHEEAKPWIARALYTPFFSPAILRSNGIAFFRAPLVYLGVLLRLIAITIVRPRTMIRTLAFFPKAVHLSVILPRLGIKHVHAHFASHATTVAWIIASLSRITYSFTVYGPDVFVHRVLLPQKIAGAKFIRSVSLFNEAFLGGLYPALTEGKIAVVHSGVDADVYDEIAAQSGAIGGPLRLLSVAAKTRGQVLSVLLEACARLEKSGLEFECNIVGKGPLRMTREQWIARRDLSARVHLLGQQPQHEVARLMAATDIFVLPSIIGMNGQMDGIPISLMEAMAARKPVITSPVSGIPELVQHGVSGILVDAAYVGRLADAVQMLASDRALRERLGGTGQAKVRREFDARRNAESLIALFDGQRRVNEAPQTIGERVRSLRWDRLGAQALGVRRVHHHSDKFLAEVQISDGIERRDVIVRRPHGEDAVARVRAEFEILSKLRDCMGADAINTVPGVLMFDEPNASLVLERADGRALASCMSESTMRHAGSWLRAFHGCTRGDEDGRNTLTAALFFAHRDLDRAAAADRWVRRRHQAILAAMRTLEGCVAGNVPPVVGQHGNFRPKNVFIGERRVVVIDFGSYREGLAAEDVAQMLLYADRPELRRAFLDGYGSTVDSDSLRLFTIAKALAALGRTGVTSRQRRNLRRAVEKALA